VSREFELLHHMEDMSLDRRTIVGRRGPAKFLLTFNHCGHASSYSFNSKPTDLSCRCRFCGAMVAATLREVVQEKVE
jgi:hypothetical protein